MPVILSLVLCVGAAPATARPQSTRDTIPRAELDSLRARLERAEEVLELLRQQLAAQASSGVQTRSRAQLELTGRVLVNAFGNSRRVNNVDNPQFVRPDTVSTIAVRGGGMAIRQTSIGAIVTVPRVLGGSFRGDLDVDFYGGQQPSSGGRTFPLLRLRTARGAVTWTYGELMVGQESPLIAGLNPVSLAGLGTPDFTAAGNLWLWLPQLRLTAETGGTLKLGLQAAVLAPTSGDAAGAFDTDLDAAERSGRPYVQSRVRARWGAEDRAGEIGVGAHMGWLAAGDSLLESRAVSADLRIPLGPWLEVRGEAFSGRLLRGLGGGGIGQSFGIAPTGPAPILDDRGGWAQLNIRIRQTSTLGGGCGVDDPDDADRPVRRMNTVCEGHLILRPAGPLVLGFEYRRLATRYAAGTLSNDHLNIAFGFEF